MSLVARSWTEETWLEGRPDEILATLTDPEAIAAEYLLHPVAGGSRLRASVSVSGRGPFGALLARAVTGLLAAGVLRASVHRLARQFPRYGS